MSENSFDESVEVQDDEIEQKIRARAEALRKQSDSKFKESSNSSIGSISDEDELQNLVKQQVKLGIADRQDISKINMQREEDDDPEEFQDILTEFPEQFEEDSINVLQDDEARKIAELKNDHERTLDSYNKEMKKANKLSITGYSNSSELNNSKNTDGDVKNHTVLFGNNFANTSEGSSMVKNKSKEDDDQKSPEESAQKHDKTSPEFSMKKQIEDFIKKAEDEYRNDNIVLDKIPEEDSEHNNLYKTPSPRESLKQEEYDENSFFSSVASLNGEINIEDDLTTNRNSEVNQEWDSIVKQASNDKAKIPNLAQTGKLSNFLTQTEQKRTQMRDDYSRKYMRNHPSGVGHNDPKYRDVLSKTMLQSDDFSEIESEKEREEAKKIVKIEIIIVMLRNKNLHKSMISDFEQNRCRIYMLDILRNNPNCEEAHYGISQIYYSLGIYDKAMEHIKTALRSSPRESQFLALKALYLYTMMQWTEEKHQYATHFRDCEAACVETLENDKENLTALYILLILSCETRHKTHQENHPEIASGRPAEKYAVQIKAISDYLGYIAWSEIYISSDKISEAEEVLEDLCYTYPTFPHAFLKLWDHRFRMKKYIESIEPIEDIFLRLADFHTIPEIRIAIVPLMYAKTLVKLNQYVYAYELLQNEFCKRPVYTVFLYFLGKFALISGEKRFKGTAVGILQECLRSCVSQRKAKILYYLGYAYRDMNQPMRAFDYFEQSIEYYNNRNYNYNPCEPEMMEEMKDFMKQHYELSQLRHLIINSASKAKQERKKNGDYQVSEDEIENLKAASKRIAKDDKYEGWMLRGKIITDVQDDAKEAVKYFTAMIDKVPYNIQGYIQFFKFLKQRNLKGKLEYVTSKMMKNIDNPNVPTDDWVQAHLTRAEALVMLNRHAQAIDVLENLVYIIPPLPIPGLKYLAKLEKKHSSEEAPQNEEGSVQITYDNNGAGAKEETTRLTSTFKASPNKEIERKEEEEKGEITINVIPSENTPKNFRPYNLNFSERGNVMPQRNARPYSSSLLNSYNRGRAVSRYGGSIFGTEVNRESIVSRNTEMYHFDIENFSVSTELKFLFEIGKICADSGVQPRNGIEALADFIAILNYYKEDMDQITFRKMYCESNLNLAKNYLAIGKPEKAQKIAKSIYDEAVKLDGPKERGHNAVPDLEDAHRQKIDRVVVHSSSNLSYRAELDNILQTEEQAE